MKLMIFNGVGYPELHRDGLLHGLRLGRIGTKKISPIWTDFSIVGLTNLA